MSNFAKLKIAEEKVLIFAKRYSSESKIVIELFEQFRIEPKAFEVINLDERQDAAEIENYLHFLCLTDTREVPQVFVKGQYIGGYYEVTRAHAAGTLRPLLANKEIPLDYVKPRPPVQVTIEYDKPGKGVRRRGRH